MSKMEYEFKKEYRNIMDSVPHKSIGAPTSIKTANQISEVNKRLNAGVYGIDIAAVDPQVFESIPKQHLKEIKRLVELNDAKLDLHAPIVDLVGMNQQGQIDEGQRRETELQMKSFFERAHELDDKGNIPVNFHVNTGLPGENKRKMTKEDIDHWKSKLKRLDEEDRKTVQKMIDEKEYVMSMGVVNQEDHKATILESELKHYPTRDVLWDPQKRLDTMNHTTWDAEKLKIMEWKKRWREIEEEKKEKELEFIDLQHKRKLNLIKEDDPQYQAAIKSMNTFEKHKHELDVHIASTLTDMHNKFVRFEPGGRSERVKKDDEKALKNMKKIGEELKKVKNQDSMEGALKARDLIEKASDFVLDLSAPDVWAPADKVAMEETAKTVSNVMLDSYEKFGKYTPTFTLENFRPELALGSAEKLRDVIKESRKQFAEKLVKDRGLTKTEAKAAAEKFIAATWDVGHANFLRKQGYSEEDIIKEAKRIGPFVKQIHITDNFGFTDSHLPPGMGNVPIKEQIDAIRKGGKFDFDKGNLIVEAGGFAVGFEQNPHMYALEGLSSPVYPGGALWGDVRELEGVYRTGFGEMLPDVHFKSLYGGGFSNLPPELGGQIGGGDKGRFAQGR